MKIYNIFTKNIKVVARNWIYFLVLFIFPFFLIFTSAILLNSSDLKNVRLGVVNDYPNYYIDISEFGKISYYFTIWECLYDLANYKVSVCVHVQDFGGKPHIDVHVDNTRRIIELYVRQSILEKIFREQTQFIETTSDFIDSRLTVYSTSVDEGILEIIEVENQLLEQERVLYDYQNNLTIIRQDFDEVYYSLKNLQS